MNGVSGGAERVRTADLRVANATLSQLSYGPISLGHVCRGPPWLRPASEPGLPWPRTTPGARRVASL